MTLTYTTLIMGLVLLLKGGWFLWNGKPVERINKASLRNRPTTFVLLVLATVWFIWNITGLGPSDFGNYKHYMIVFVMGIAVGSWFYVPDFLAVRAACGIALLFSNVVLHSAFALYDLPQRLFLVTFTYLLITASIYFGVVPYRMRDLLDWMHAKTIRIRCIGGIMAVYGLILIGTLFTY